jgi:hypothetical protein
MAQRTHNKLNLYEDAKAGLSSLIQQTIAVFLGFAVMLIVTGGAPSGFVIALSFCLGTAFVSWHEQQRVRNPKAVIPPVIIYGFEKTAEFPSEQGSWWKQIFYRTKDAVSQKGVQKRLEKVERAVKANYLDKPQAEANAHQAVAVSSLINALKEIPNACIQVGSLLVVKTGDDNKSIVLARTLTAEELKRLKENQSMLRHPDLILEWLNENNDAVEVKSDSDV